MLSVLVHVLAVVIAWCVVQSIAAPVLFGQVFLLVPPVMLITMMPISIAGWGVREATMGLAFGFAGLAANEGVNVSLLFGAVSSSSAQSAAWSGSSARRRPRKGRRRSECRSEPGHDALAPVLAACRHDRRTDIGAHHLDQPSPAPALRPGATECAFLASHSTPQGAGIAVIAATLLVASALAAWANVAIPPALVIATVVIALVGFADDIVSLPVLVRLVLQAACVGAVVFTAPETARIVDAGPRAQDVPGAACGSRRSWAVASPRHPAPLPAPASWAHRIRR